MKRNGRFHSSLALVAMTLSLGGFAAGGATPASAQAAPPPAGAHGQRFGQMLLSLNLSDAQKDKIRGIIAAARQKNETVTDPQVKRSNMRAAYADVRTVLTPAQLSKLNAELAAAKAEREHADHS